MRYTTNYDIGDRKRGAGINEDSVSMTVFEEGHRDGYRGQRRGSSDGADSEEPTETGADGDADAESVDENGTDDDAAATADEEEMSDDGTKTAADDRPANRSAGVFVLADGAGGHDAGDAASYIATTVVAERLAPIAIRAARSHPEDFGVDIDPGVRPETLGPEEIRNAIENAVIEAHREVIRYAAESGSQSYTTVVAGVYADGNLHLGWVGDSRAYLINRAHERIVPLTKDHAVVQQWEDDGEIDEVEAHVHPNGNEITRALGGSGHEDPETAAVAVDTRTVRLFAEDTVLATSDGLIDAQTSAPELYDQYVDSDRSSEMAETVREAVVTDDEIRDVILDADSLDDAAREYVSLANDRGGKDNISVLLFADDALPETPSGTLPVRAVDPDIDIGDRDTVLINE